MTIADEYISEKSRIENTILEAINTSLDPVTASRKALKGAFPAATFVDKEDGTLSVQNLDAAQRQSLEDALFELNLTLADEAVARGLPLMQFLHANAAHADIKSIPRFLQVCLELARPLLAEPLRDAEKAGGRRRLLDYEGWARLFEGLMEVGTIADCAELFRLMEGTGPGAAGPGGLGWSRVFCSDDFRREQGAKLALLRISNMLFRRLSKAYDVRLCGQLLIFISRCYELNDKSGLNVQGALNTGLALPVDEVEAGAVDSIGEQIDRRLYGCFWGLQAIFQNPAQVLQEPVYRKVLADMGSVLAEFGAIKNPVAATGPWVAQRGQGQGGQGAMEVDGGGVVAAVEADAGSGAGARYLTSSKLFGLQLRDCTFRRHFLLQCLALLQYIEQPSKLDKSAVGPKPEGLEALRNKLYTALAETKDHGPEVAAAVRAVLASEAHWVAWKHGTQPPGGLGGPLPQAPAAGAAAAGGAAPASAAAAGSELCRDFSRPPAPPLREAASTSAGDGPPNKRRRGAAGRSAGGAGAGGAAGRYAVSRGVAPLPDSLAGLRVGERRIKARDVMGEETVVPMLPSAEELLVPILEDLDPDNDVEAPYRRVRDTAFAWRRMRTLARNCLEHYKKGDDLEDSVLDMHPALRDRIAARQREREAELAAAAAAEAAEAGEVLPDAPGQGGKGSEEGEAKAEEGEAEPSPNKPSPRKAGKAVKQEGS
ncbi:hypothetical protein HYH03_015778 [Edaphochlamys debaryana]|uniref:Uncharacterized protein n=1 Tax=Edaphochlamys debaryana TaxID=47281 RepID=A0A835XL98_9CHLO|nr:hypothetical protein HYH03_015778 [Edaphochlamys debaryana]|eukprot:KAG2485505.1 hypothetical protein HYH03_015778 [Edaphochlamys debaryana]